jgi:hypothetical protein
MIDGEWYKGKQSGKLYRLIRWGITAKRVYCETEARVYAWYESDDCYLSSTPPPVTVSDLKDLERGKLPNGDIIMRIDIKCRCPLDHFVSVRNENNELDQIEADTPCERIE